MKFGIGVATAALLLSVTPVSIQLPGQKDSFSPIALDKASADGFDERRIRHRRVIRSRAVRLYDPLCGGPYVGGGFNGGTYWGGPFMDLRCYPLAVVPASTTVLSVRG